VQYYAAIGEYIILKENGKKDPAIQRMGKYHPISVPEFALWGCLAKEIMTEEELQERFENQYHLNGVCGVDFRKMLQTLIARNLIICGTGETGEAALYDMLRSVFVIPNRKRCMTIADYLSLKHERKVYRLIRDMPLSMCELIRCLDLKIRRVGNPERFLMKLYPNGEMHENLSAADCSPNRRTAIEAVCNLYLAGRVYLEAPACIAS